MSGVTEEVNSLSEEPVTSEWRSGGSCGSECRGRRLFLSGTSLTGLNGASGMVVWSLMV